MRSSDEDFSNRKNAMNSVLCGKVFMHILSAR